MPGLLKIIPRNLLLRIGKKRKVNQPKPLKENAIHM